MLSLAAKSCP
ncbi:hypothetical protein MXB_1286 [Myxobolus squamalis]|nr:hypothetical protein MXB_1286 [Myxobolus squamalis]